MSDKESGELGVSQAPKISWPWVLAAVASLYGYWAIQGQLESSRPDSKLLRSPHQLSPMPGMGSVRSRMWQDPLMAPFADYESVSADGGEIGLVVQDGELPDTSALRDDFIEWAEASRRNAEPPIDLSGAVDSEAAVLQNQMKSLIEGKNKKTVCLFAFIPGGLYAEDQETRLRMRYAAVTALAESQYYLHSSRRMDYVAPALTTRVMRGWATRDVVVPVELYRHDVDSDQQVLLLWIDESVLGLRPLLTVSRLMNHLFGSVAPEAVDRMRVSVVGPASSTALLGESGITGDVKSFDAAVEMRRWIDAAQESGKEVEEPPEMSEEALHWFLSDDFYLFRDFAASAVVSGMVPLLDRRNGQPLKIYSPRATNSEIEFPESSNVSLERVIDTDLKLAHALREELEKRDALNGNIILITEHDTGYGRAIPNAISEGFIFDTKISPVFDSNGCYTCHGDGDQTRLDRLRGARAAKPSLERWLASWKAPSKDASGACEFGELKRKPVWRKSSRFSIIEQWVQDEESVVDFNLHTFKMFQGIDGELPDEESAGKSKSSESSGDGEAEYERYPAGRSQFDYLTRLRRRINDIGNVAAIGVTGSDVYDKLLVIRALKPHFPNSVFFTTDMDVIYTHPEELRHTRGLLIASHFGLALNKQLQASTAPFRDSYQTATFLATLRALEEDSMGVGVTNRWTHSEHQATPPLLHVVGRRDFQRLDAEDSVSTAHWTPPRSVLSTRWVWVLYFVSSFLFVGFIFKSNEGLRIWNPVNWRAVLHVPRDLWEALRVARFLIFGVLAVAIALWVWAIRHEDIFAGHTTILANGIRNVITLVSLALMSFFAARFWRTFDGEGLSLGLAADGAKERRRCELAGVLGIAVSFSLMYNGLQEELVLVLFLLALSVYRRVFEFERSEESPWRAVGVSFLRAKANVGRDELALGALVIGTSVSIWALFQELNIWGVPERVGWFVEPMSSGVGKRGADRLSVFLGMGVLLFGLFTMGWLSMRLAAISRALAESRRDMREFQAECLTRMKSLRDLFKILEMAYGWTLVCMAVFVLSFHPALSSWAVALSVQCVLTLAFLAGLGMNLFLRWRLQRLMDRDAPVSSVDPFEVGAEAYGFANAMINGRAISRLPAVVWIGAIGAFLALADGWIRWWAILI